MRIDDLPGCERPRERLASVGAGSLSERELIALVLRNGVAGNDVVDVAAKLLRQFGSLAMLARADVFDLVGTLGIGAAKASALVAAFELGRRADGAAVSASLGNAHDVVRAVQPSLRDLRRERVVVLVCNSANRVVRMVTVADGAMDHCLMPIREVMNAVLRFDGRGFAIAHNHPSGDPEPSPDDVIATNKLRMAASVVGLRMLEHVIVAGDAWRAVKP